MHAVRPVRIRRPRENDSGDVSRIVGYSGTCACGTPTPRLSSVAAVRAWKAVHKAQGHPRL